MGAITRDSLSRVISPMIAAIYFNRLKRRPDEYSQWINIRSSKRAFEIDSKMAGLGNFVRKAEGAVFTFDEPLPGDEVKYVHQTFALAFRVTEEMREDDQWGIVNKMSNELAMSAAYNWNIQAFSVLNNGFNSAYQGFDNLPLFHAAHTRLDGGGTQSNIGNADVGTLGIQQAIEASENLVNDRGMPVLGAEPKFLIHGPASIWATGEVLGSEYDPNVAASNKINVIATKYNLVPKLVHFLTDPDAWFLLSSKEVHDLNLYRRVADQFRAADDPLTGDSLNMGRHRLSVGFGGWEGAWGSPGA
jgi:hypothetical protein